MADTIRLGSIGTGLAVEKLHWPALKRMTDKFRVTAFCEIERSHAEHFAGYSGASMDDFTTDYHELLARDDVDAVLISLPIPLNYPVTRDALEAGKDVICEKPTGANADDMRAFAELPGQYPDRLVEIAENWFYRDDLRQARALLDQGILGRVHLMAWRNVSQLVPQEGEFSSTPWRQDAEYVGGLGERDEGFGVGQDIVAAREGTHPHNGSRYGLACIRWHARIPRLRSWWPHPAARSSGQPEDIT